MTWPLLQGDLLLIGDYNPRDEKNPKLKQMLFHIDMNAWQRLESLGSDNCEIEKLN